MRRIGFASAVFVFLGALQLGSQTTSTAILGTVTDPTGAVVTGAKVTLLQVQTGVKRTEATSSTGDYTFPLLDPGEYTVTVEAKGFKTETVRDIKPGTEPARAYRRSLASRRGSADGQGEYLSRPAQHRPGDARPGCGYAADRRVADGRPQSGGGGGAAARNSVRWPYGADECERRFWRCAGTGRLRHAERQRPARHRLSRHAGRRFGHRGAREYPALHSLTGSGAGVHGAGRHLLGGV